METEKSKDPCKDIIGHRSPVWDPKKMNWVPSDKGPMHTGDVLPKRED